MAVAVVAVVVVVVVVVVVSYESNGGLSQQHVPCCSALLACTIEWVVGGAEVSLWEPFLTNIKLRRYRTTTGAACGGHRRD